ncbi:hypothetical protein [Bosea vestrisii]|uniref:Terminase small subunit n=1 Tax=Bosea vestrisii TaxID=151416 RepID=A0ABW0HB29_9HYPH
MTMSFDDLLGTEITPLKRGPGRPRGPNYVPPPDQDKRPRFNDLTGVTIPWLARMFKKSRATVQTSLQNCEPIGSKGGGPLYDLSEAASYLVVPRRDVRDFMKTITVKDLPQELRETFWNAKIKEAKFRVIAGELWPTQSVLDVLGETFKTIKTTTQLWTDTIDETTGLTNEQRDMLIKLSDRLMADLHEALIVNAKASATESFLSELDDESA